MSCSKPYRLRISGVKAPSQRRNVPAVASLDDAHLSTDPDFDRPNSPAKEITLDSPGPIHRLEGDLGWLPLLMMSLVSRSTALSIGSTSAISMGVRPCAFFSSSGAP